jgi:uncharacterized protein YciI
MLYAFICEDVPDSLPKRKAARPDHLARVEELQAAGRVIVGGPLPAIDSVEPGEAGFTGSLLVAEFDSLEEAEALLQDDPYVKAGVFANTTVTPFLRVF